MTLTQLVEIGANIETQFGDAKCRDDQYTAAEAELYRVCKLYEDLGYYHVGGTANNNGSQLQIYHDRMTCDHIKDAMEVWYYTAGPGYHVSVEAFCTLIVQEIIGEAEEPACMEWMVSFTSGMLRRF